MLTDLYVLASRVRLGRRLYVIGFDPSEESGHLRRLTHAPVLGIWRTGYDETTGCWDAQRAARAAAQLAKRKAEAAAGAASRRQVRDSGGQKRAGGAAQAPPPKR